VRTIAGQWRTPPDYEPKDHPEGHICHDVIQRGGHEALVVRNLHETEYAVSDPNVGRYGLKSYVGHPVLRDADVVGALCAVFQADFAPSPDDLTVLEIIAAALSREENRMFAMERLSELRTAVEQCADGIALADLNGQLRFVNDAWSRMHGYSSNELVGRHLSVFHNKEQLETEVNPFNRRLLESDSVEGEVGHVRRDGTTFRTRMVTTLLRGQGQTPFGILGTAHDITERRRLEERLKVADMDLRQSQKLQAVGQLAAGIAHEINTPVQFIGDSLQFLLESFGSQQGLLVKYREALAPLVKASGNEAIARELTEAETATDLTYIDEHAPAAFERAMEGVGRISTIVKAMRTFGHPDGAEKIPANLNQALLTTLIISRNEYKYVADVETELGEIPPVLCLIGELNQVFLNLIVNAAHAIADVVGQSGNRGVIRIRTTCEVDNVRIEFSDTGGGVPEKIKSRIFEPFFTTKEVGRGTGQGLAIAHSVVVDKHGGSLTFETEAGKGTTFIVLLPIVGAPSKAPVATPTSAVT
jgi:PAS domain S-box-containing protein